MRRRALLAALTAGVSATAGCSAFQSPDDSRGTFDVDETTTEPPTTFPTNAQTPVEPGFTVPGDDDHAVVVTRPTGIPDDVALTVGVSVEPSKENPARVSVQLAVPESASEPVTLPVGATPPFSSYESAANDAGRSMMLVPRRRGVDRETIVKRDRGCWRPRVRNLPDETSSTVVLDPGESLAREYYLVAAWSSDVCHPTGVFAFEADAGWSFAVSSFEIAEPGRSPFAGTDVPPLPEYQATRWYHEGDEDVFVSPSAESLGLPTATVRLRFRNQLWRTVRLDARSWALYKFADEEWYPIAPLSNVDDRREVLPGGTTDVQLSLTTDPDAAGDERTAVGGLGDGTYAVAYPSVISIPGPPSTDGAGGPPAALVSVVGEPPEFDASPALHHVDDSSDVRHAYTQADESSVATLRVERSDADDVPRLLREQVLQRDALRDAVFVLEDAAEAGEDADAVVYHTDASVIERTTALIDPDGDGYAFRFEGDAYELSYG